MTLSHFLKAHLGICIAAMLCCLLPASSLAAKPSQETANKPAEVAFDFFTYSGQDHTIDDSSKALSAGYYRNPILTGFYPDPSICKAGNDYYLINSTFGYFPGIPIFHSRDLVNWQLIGHAIDRTTQLDYQGIGVTRGLFAPAISYHNGVFYIVCTMIGGKGNFVITATDPAGPWSDPVWLDFSGIDPSIFFDDDGRTWIVHNGEAPNNKPLYDGHRAIWLREFDPIAKRMVGEPRLLVNGGVNLAAKPVWIEGPHLYKRNGWYYLCCAEGGTSIQHSQVIFRSRSVTGPFEPWSGNPILTQREFDPTAPGAVTCTGHADLVESPGGSWWAVFLGCRPFAEGKYFTAGRETFLLPVTWTDDGWPVILPAGERVPLVTPRPTGASTTNVSNAPFQLNGNFTSVDHFTSPTLPSSWIMLRTPAEGTSDWRIDTKRERLLLTPAPVTLSDTKTHPAFLARRVQHANFTATTAIDLPLSDHVSAGLAILQSERNYYFLAVRRTQDSNSAEIIVELADRSAPTIIHSTGLPKGIKQIQLRATANLTKLQFAWSSDGKKWTTFDAPAGILPVTTEAAGGGIHFTGAVVGMHARIDQEPTLSAAFKDSFLIGAALNNAHVAKKKHAHTDLITSQFNSLTPENAMKWSHIHPLLGKYDFTEADRYVDFGAKHGMTVIGHTLVWHQQTPKWVFENTDGTPATREVLLERMRDHIHTVVGRYKGRIKGWDVVNEALNEDGTMRDSPWRKIIGDDFVAHAFRFAHEADPGAELYYNDFSIENPAKRAGAVALLRKLQAEGIPVSGVGIQEHVNLKWPDLKDLEDSITTFANLGLKVMITELEVDVLPSDPRTTANGNAEITRQTTADPAYNPYTKGLPTEVQEQFARRYAEIFQVYLKHRDVITRVTFWGVTDDSSWLNNWPIRGRTNYPLLFDRNGKPKPAFEAVIKTATH